MDADSFIAHMKSEDGYADLAKDVKTRFDTSNYKVKRSISSEKKQKGD